MAEYDPFKPSAIEKLVAGVLVLLFFVVLVLVPVGGLLAVVVWQFWQGHILAGFELLGGAFAVLVLLGVVWIAVSDGSLDGKSFG